MGDHMCLRNINVNNFISIIMNIQNEYQQHVSKRKELKDNAVIRMSEIREQIRDLHSEEANIETILMELSQ